MSEKEEKTIKEFMKGMIFVKMFVDAALYLLNLLRKIFGYMPGGGNGGNGGSILQFLLDNLDTIVEILLHLLILLYTMKIMREELDEATNNISYSPVDPSISDYENIQRYVSQNLNLY